MDDIVYHLSALLGLAGVFYFSAAISRLISRRKQPTPSMKLIRLALDGGYAFLICGIAVSYLYSPLVRELRPYIQTVGQLICGWAGLILGSSTGPRVLASLNRAHSRQAFSYSLLLFFAVLAVLLVFKYQFKIFFYIYEGPEFIGLAVLLALMASLSSPFFISSLKKRFYLGSEAATYIGALGFIWVVPAAGLLHAWYSDGPWWADGMARMVEVAGLSVLVGAVMGYFLRILTRFTLHNHDRFLLLNAMLLFTTGVSVYLHLSPLFVNFICGLTAVRSRRSSAWLDRNLGLNELPYYHVFLFLLGLAWPPAFWPALPALLIYLGIRLAAILFSSSLVVRSRVPFEPGGEPQKPLPLYPLLLPQEGLVPVLVWSFIGLLPGAVEQKLIVIAAGALMVFPVLAVLRLYGKISHGRQAPLEQSTT